MWENVCSMAYFPEKYAMRAGKGYCKERCTHKQCTS